MCGIGSSGLKHHVLTLISFADLVFKDSAALRTTINGLKRTTFTALNGMLYQKRRHGGASDNSESD